MELRSTKAARLPLREGNREEEWEGGGVGGKERAKGEGESERGGKERGRGRRSGRERGKEREGRVRVERGWREGGGGEQ